eukprot:TRINITY_DN4663_c0_g1_i1.p1 TRINITY_DN4663_c0_g1~~TRINITY_DN4663_c0_g1_i1.p1  ORF type:complete len:331 (-),score=72.58 TRINITY_DN4663_c0_g1_i1:24-1016(-)
MQKTKNFKPTKQNQQNEFQNHLLREDNIRRFGSNGDLSYKDFVGLLGKLYGGLGLWSSGCELRYQDEDGDLVNVGSQMEWEEMAVLCKGKLIRLTVSPPRESNGRHGAPWGCGGIHPCQRFLPSFLTDNIGNLPTFVPFGLQGMPGRFLYHFLHREGIQALDRKDFQTARTLFASLSTLQPEDPISHYNLACAESLLGSVEAAATALVRSIEVGYNDLEHLLSDPDLENLKVQSPARFGEICSLLRPQEGRSEGDGVGGEGGRKVEVVVPLEVAAPPRVEETWKKEEVTESKWGKELEMLHEFGFHSDVLLIELLEQTEGSIQKTIELLL